MAERKRYSDVQRLPRKQKPQALVRAADTSQGDHNLTVRTVHAWCNEIIHIGNQKPPSD